MGTGRSHAALLEVWREACRHIAIDESIETITPILVREIPIGQIYVRRIDRHRQYVETVAVGIPDRATPHARTECSSSQLRKLLAWCRRGEVARRGRQSSGTGHWQLAVPEGIEQDLLVGPLGSSEGVCGVLIMVAEACHEFSARQVALMQSLLEPFSVALANDQQIRELATLREAAEARARSLLNRLGRNRLEETIVGTESGLAAVMERVTLVAPSDVPVLIFGETGTGKEVIARAIHHRSPRAAGPINRVNCGAIPSELIDSELFGHERGAFTGAVEARRGWFERADGGTLFLDEIGELPPAAQVRLLRILQDGWLERVGGRHPIHVDVRIVAATHRDLAQMVEHGRFRQDLWYRISVFPILLPPLRERPQDIDELIRHFAERAATRFGLPRVPVSPNDIELLKSYAWPGNVRELGTVIDRAAILGDGRSLEVAKALGITTALPTASPATNAEPLPGATVPQPAIESLDTAMRRHIEAALTACRGRIEGPFGAALLLQINPHTLRARMRKLGIDWKQFRQHQH